jgi:hypothetical protein
MPSEYDIAVETYVNPLDFFQRCQNKNLVWWLAYYCVFRLARYVLWNIWRVAVEKFISDNGRVLIAPDPNEDPQNN